MANGIQKMEGKKATTYRVRWWIQPPNRATGFKGEQGSRTWASEKAAKDYAAWRRLNPEAPESDYDVPTAAAIIVNDADSRAAVPTVAQLYKRLTDGQGESIGRARKIAQDSVYRSQLAKLHNKRVTDLRAGDLRIWLNGVRKPDGTPYAPRTIGDALTLLRQILDLAVEDGWLIGNPADSVKGPKRRTKGQIRKSDVLTPEELTAVLGKIPAHWQGLFYVLGYTGCRLSEALGLTTDYVHIERDADGTPISGYVVLGLRVAEEVQGKIVIREYTEDSHADDLTAKTEASEGRIVALPAVALPVLAAHLETVKPGQPLFPTERSGTIISRSSLRQRVWNPAREAAGITRAIPMRNLRHSHLSHAIDAGMPLGAVAARGGHAKSSTTQNFYERFITNPEADARNNAALNAYLGK